MLKEHCFDRKYVIVPYGTIFATLVTKGLRTNKPMRMDFLSIFLGDFRGPRKTVFLS